MMKLVGSESELIFSTVLNGILSVQRLAMHMFWWLNACKTENSRAEVGEVYKFIILSVRASGKVFPFFGKIYDHRDPQTAFI